MFAAGQHHRQTQADCDRVLRHFPEGSFQAFRINSPVAWPSLASEKEMYGPRATTSHPGSP